MSADTGVPEANWNQYPGTETAQSMNNVDRRSWARKAFDKIKGNSIAASGVAGVIVLTIAGGAVNQEQTNTPNPDQQRIHQMERNGMPQSDEAVRLDKEFPADHVQTKDVIISSNAELLTAPTDNADRVNN